MPVIATNTVESRRCSLSEHRQILVNIELNQTCVHTKLCGNACYLNLVSPKNRKPLAADHIFSAAREVIHGGRHIRHLVLPGKEVWETPELLPRIVEEFHATPVHVRPGDINIITASPEGIKRHTPQLADNPLGGTNISMDTPESGLRFQRNNVPLLEAALQLKNAGGTECIGVNTVLTQQNVGAAIEIGKRLLGIGVDQWTLGPLLLPKDGRMESVLSVAELSEIIDCVAQEFAGTDLNIVFDLDLPLLRGLTDAEEVFAVGERRWRFEYEMPGAPNILLEAGNPQPGYFFRMDWSGQLLSKEDYRWIGKEGSYGEYVPGRITEVLNEFRLTRRAPAELSAA